MILKGSKRGGAVELGKHLLKSENEHVEVHEIRGFVSDNVIDAFKEAYAISRGTKCQKFLYSLSLNPPENENVPVKAFEEAIETIEAKLGLTDQPRVIIFHEKQSRRHAHCVWSRINGATMTAIDQPHFKLKLQDISRKLYLEHGWTMPNGLIDPLFRNPLNFDRKEWFQAERTGQDPRLIKAAFQRCWQASDSAKAFRQALEQRGYYLARGDRRGVVAIDIYGEVYAAARWANVKTKQMAERMGDLNTLPSVADIQVQVSNLVHEKVSGFVETVRADFAIAAQTLEAKRLKMVACHRAARRELMATQDARRIKEARERAERFRKGLLGLWDRVSGQHAKLRGKNELEAANCAERDTMERQQLVDYQLTERRRLQHEINQQRRRHVRETAWIYRCTGPDGKGRRVWSRLNGRGKHVRNSEGPSGP